MNNVAVKFDEIFIYCLFCLINIIDIIEDCYYNIYY